MRLTLSEYNPSRDVGASHAVVGIDDQGNRQVLAAEWVAGLVPLAAEWVASMVPLVGEWVAGLVPLVAERVSVYAVDGSCLTKAQIDLVGAFVRARLNNGLPLDGAALEV
jgi:hypothetical protein